MLTATPVKNRLPDISRLAWWSAGGKAAAHARFPYRDDSSEREKFAQTFMVSERNVSKESAAKARGERVTNSRYKKLTAEELQRASALETARTDCAATPEAGCG